MQYKGKQIVDIPSSGTKYVPITVHLADEVKNLAITDISVIADSVYAQIGDGTYFWNEVEVPVIGPYLSFIEENSEPFTLKTSNNFKNWNGTLYYSTDANSWTEWNGAEISSSNNGKLYVRGKNNTRIADNKRFVLTSNKHIQCQGNIENLLDYETVEQGNHPVMARNCYSSMFRDCTSLTQAPELPATELADNCYSDMFYGCTSLTQAPELPATMLTELCYCGMFYHCTSLTAAPDLPATTLTKSCYQRMFQGCISLTQAPEELPATTLAENCYYSMFDGCRSLTGQIHCTSSTANNDYRLTSQDIIGSSATIVFDL